MGSRLEAPIDTTVQVWLYVGLCSEDVHAIEVSVLRKILMFLVAVGEV